MLPCGELRCQVLARLESGIDPEKFTQSMDELKACADRLSRWFEANGTSTEDALGIMELLKLAIWDERISHN